MRKLLLLLTTLLLTAGHAQAQTSLAFDAAAETALGVATEGLTFVGGEAVNFTLPEATGTGTISYTLLDAADANLETAHGLTFTSDDRTLLGEPSSSDEQIAVTYSATDDSATVSLTFLITLQAPAPDFSPETLQDQVYTVGALVSLTLPEASNALDGEATFGYTLAPDLEGSGLTYSAADRVLAGAPTAALAATEATYTATQESLDYGGGVNELKFNITINEAPALAFDPAEVADQTFLTGATITALDLPTASGGISAYTYTLGGTIPADLSFYDGDSDDNGVADATPTLTGTLSADAEASPLTFTVSDSASPTAITLSLTFSVTVNAPEALAFTPADVDDQTYITGGLITALDLPTASGGVSAYTYTLGGAPAGLTFNDGDSDDNGVADITPTLSGAATADTAATPLTFSVTDSASPTAATLSLTFTVTVNAPTVLLLNPATLSDQTYTNGGVITALRLPTGLGGEPEYTYALGGEIPSGLTFTDGDSDDNGVADQAATLTGIPDSAVSDIPLTFSITDSASSAATVNLTFTVTVNDPEPLVLSPAEVADQTYTTDITIPILTLPTAGGGIPAYSYTLGGEIPAGLTYNDGDSDNDGVPDQAATLTGAATTLGEAASLTFIVTDSANPTPVSTELVFSVTVIAPIPLGFTVGVVDDQNYFMGREGSTLTLPTAVGGTEPYSYTLGGEVPAGITFYNGDSDNDGVVDEALTLGGTPTVEPGDYRLTFTVTDSASPTATASLDFFVIIGAAPEPLVFDPTEVATQTYIENREITDLTLPTVSGGHFLQIYLYRLEGEPDGLMLRALADRRVMEGTPNIGTEGNHSLTFTVTDTVLGDMISLTFAVVVEAAPIPLSLRPNSVADQSYTAETDIGTEELPAAFGGTAPYTYTLGGVVPADLIFYDGDSDDDGMADTDAIPTLTGTPTAAVVGDHSLTFTVTDSADPVATLNRVIAVNVEAVPATLQFNTRARDQLGATATGDTGGLTFIGGTTVDMILPQASGASDIGYTLTHASQDLESHGLTFTSATRRWAGNITSDDLQLTLTYTASANGMTASLLFNFLVQTPPPNFAEGAEIDLTFFVGRRVNQQLPRAVGALSTTRTIDYGINALATQVMRGIGLTFILSTRTLVGTPTATLAPTELSYRASQRGRINGLPRYLLGPVTVTLPPLTFNPAELSEQTYAVSTPIETFTLPAASGGTGALSFSLTGTPAGLSFDAAATPPTLSGTASTVGDYDLTYTVTDSATPTPVITNLIFQVTVEAAPLSLSSPVPSVAYRRGEAIAPFTLPIGLGGTAPYSYTLGGDLPLGLTYNDGDSDADGTADTAATIVGTPTTPASNISMTFTVSDSASPAESTFNRFEFDILDIEDDLSFEFTELDDQTYTEEVDIGALTLPTPSGGSGGYRYRLAGAPAGLIFTPPPTPLDVTTLSGAPDLRSVGEYSLTFTVIDTATLNSETTFSRSLTFAVTVELAENAPLRVDPGALPEQTFVVAATTSTLQLPIARGGTAPYTYTLGGAPSGLSFDAAADPSTLSGTAEDDTVGTHSLTFSATDTASPVATVNLTFSVRVLPEGGGICDRAAEVRTAIVAALSGIEDCALVATTDLEGLEALSVSDTSISSLQASDFASLSALKSLLLSRNAFTTLPADLFSGVPALETLHLNGNGLTELPAELFSGVPALTELRLDANALSALPAGLFDPLTSLQTLHMGGAGNTYAALPENLFTPVLDTLTFFGAPSTIFPFSADINVINPMGDISEGRPHTVSINLLPNVRLFPVRIPYTITLGGGATADDFHVSTACADPESGVLLLEDGVESIGLTFCPVADDTEESDETLSFSLGTALPANSDGDAINADVAAALVTISLLASGTDTLNLPLVDSDIEIAPLTFDPDTVAGQSYTVAAPIEALTLPTISGGTAPYKHALATVPAGLSFDAGATPPLLVGTPEAAAAGTHALTFTVTDILDISLSLTFSVVIGGSTSLAFDPATVAEQSYTVATTIEALTLPTISGGTEPYEYALATVPAGLSFDAAATPPLLVGTPEAAAAGTHALTFTVTDLLDTSISLTFSVVINDSDQAEDLSFDPATVAEQTYTVGVPIEPFTLPTVSGGATPYRRTFINAVTVGLTFDPSTIPPILVGTPPARVAGTQATMTYTITDNAGATASLTFTAFIKPAPQPDLVFDPSTIADQIYATGVDIAPLTLPVVTGGVGAVAYTLQGAPADLRFDATARILSGAPTATSSAQQVIYTATDSAPTPRSLSLTFQITVNGVSDRSSAVQAEILRQLSASDANAVSNADLATITTLQLESKSITTLQTNDFAGLRALQKLDLSDNSLQTLPTAIFEDLPELSFLSLSNNSLASLPQGIFGETAQQQSATATATATQTRATSDLVTTQTGAELSKLLHLDLSDNDLTALQAGIFDQLPALTTLLLNGNTALATLPAGLFSPVLDTLSFLDTAGVPNAAAVPAQVSLSGPAERTLNEGANEVLRIVLTPPLPLFHVRIGYSVTLSDGATAADFGTASGCTIPADGSVLLAPGAAGAELTFCIATDSQTEEEESLTLSLNTGGASPADANGNPAQAAVAAQLASITRHDSANQVRIVIPSSILPLVFATDTISDQRYTVEVHIPPLQLPVANGGVGAKSYSLSGAPDGLAFDATTRTLSGAPQESTLGDHSLTYSATDSAPSPSSIRLTFRVTVIEVDHLTVVNRVLLPEVARAITDQNVAAITQRISRVRDDLRRNGTATNSALAAQANLGGQNTWTGLIHNHGLTLLKGEQLNGRAILSKSDFVLPLNATHLRHDESVAQESAGVFLWGSGSYRDLKGSYKEVDWDGELVGAHLGLDTLINERLLAGLVFSQNRSDLNYDFEEEKGAHQVDLTSINPYLGWSSETGRLEAWATVGVGRGDLEIDDDTRSITSATPASTDISMLSLGAGLRSTILDKGDSLRLHLRGDAMQSRLEAEDSTTLEALKADAIRLRLALESISTIYLVGGSNIEPILEFGLRHDGADGETRNAFELAAALRHNVPRLGLTLEARLHALLGTNNYSEYGAQTTLQIAPTDGKGLSLNLSSGYGPETPTEVQQIWKQDLNLPTNNTNTPDDFHIKARLGFGIPTPTPRQKTLLTPYTQLTRNAKTTTNTLGLNWQLPTANLQLEWTKDQQEAPTTELKASFRF